MCLTCGCGRPYDKMGDMRNITVENIKDAVNTEAAQGLTGEQAIENIVKTWPKAKDEDKRYKVE